jgi:NAD(P)-dependent dehydrogenase (short-subunit alcohol dehydrogenase family)
MQSIVITGASTGIGLASVQLFIERGWRVFGSVRSETDANRLQRALGANFVPLIFDVTDSQGIRQAAGIVRDHLNGSLLDGLVNNAGIAVSGPMQLVPMDQMRLQLEVNVLGLLEVTQAFLPLLGATMDQKNKVGRIINISSVSGLFVTPFMGPYCASKFAVEAMTDAMRRELVLYGIKVVAIEPGPIQTEIWRKAKEDTTTYPESIYQPFLLNRDKIVDKRSASALPVEKVSHLIWKSMTHPQPAPRYLIAPKQWQIQLVRWLPTQLADKLLLKMMGGNPRK